jgi:hypothetical protein
MNKKNHIYIFLFIHAQILFYFLGLGLAKPIGVGLDLASPAKHWPKLVTRLGNMKHA